MYLSCEMVMDGMDQKHPIEVKGHTRAFVSGSSSVAVRPQVTGWWWCRGQLRGEAGVGLQLGERRVQDAGDRCWYRPFGKLLGGAPKTSGFCGLTELCCFFFFPFLDRVDTTGFRQGSILGFRRFRCILPWNLGYFAQKSHPGDLRDSPTRHARIPRRIVTWQPAGSDAPRSFSSFNHSYSVAGRLGFSAVGRLSDGFVPSVADRGGDQTP